MEWNNQTLEAAKRLVEGLTEAQWETVCACLPVLYSRQNGAQRPSDDDEREWEKEARRKEAALQADFEGRRTAFSEWAEKKLKGAEVPEAYDFTIGDIMPVTEYALHEKATADAVYSCICTMYKWGFKRGRACVKAAGKKAIK